MLCVGDLFPCASNEITVHMIWNKPEMTYNDQMSTEKVIGL
jgi:hypothetical protein